MPTQEFLSLDRTEEVSKAIACKCGMQQQKATATNTILQSVELNLSIHPQFALPMLEACLQNNLQRPSDPMKVQQV